MTTGAFPVRLSIVANVQNDARARQKARIHSGAVSGKQRVPPPPWNGAGRSGDRVK